MAQDPGTLPPDLGPAAGAPSVERWCRALIETRDERAKLDPPPPPDPDGDASWEREPAELRLAAPGRPDRLRVVARSPSAPRLEALADPRARARLCLTFAHHELQAAELFAWAVLAFPRAPREFRAGLVRVVRHADAPELDAAFDRLATRVVLHPARPPQRPRQRGVALGEDHPLVGPCAPPGVDRGGLVAGIHRHPSNTT